MAEVQDVQVLHYVLDDAVRKTVHGPALLGRRKLTAENTLVLVALPQLPHAVLARMAQHSLLKDLQRPCTNAGRRSAQFLLGVNNGQWSWEAVLTGGIADEEVNTERGGGSSGGAAPIACNECHFAKLSFCGMGDPDPAGKERKCWRLINREHRREWLGYADVCSMFPGDLPKHRLAAHVQKHQKEYQRLMRRALLMAGPGTDADLAAARRALHDPGDRFRLLLQGGPLLRLVRGYCGALRGLWGAFQEHWYSDWLMLQNSKTAASHRAKRLTVPLEQWSRKQVNLGRRDVAAVGEHYLLHIVLLQVPSDVSKAAFLSLDGITIPIDVPVTMILRECVDRVLASSAKDPDLAEATAASLSSLSSGGGLLSGGSDELPASPTAPDPSRSLKGNGLLKPAIAHSRPNTMASQLLAAAGRAAAAQGGLAPSLQAMLAAHFAVQGAAASVASSRPQLQASAPWRVREVPQLSLFPRAAPQQQGSNDTFSAALELSLGPPSLQQQAAALSQLPRSFPAPTSGPPHSQSTLAAAAAAAVLGLPPIGLHLPRSPPAAAASSAAYRPGSIATAAAAAVLALPPINAQLPRSPLQAGQPLPQWRRQRQGPKTEPMQRAGSATQQLADKALPLPQRLELGPRKVPRDTTPLTLGRTLPGSHGISRPSSLNNLLGSTSAHPNRPASSLQASQRPVSARLPQDPLMHRAGRISFDKPQVGATKAPRSAAPVLPTRRPTSSRPSASALLRAARQAENQAGSAAAIAAGLPKDVAAAVLQLGRSSGTKRSASTATGAEPQHQLAPVRIKPQQADGIAPSPFQLHLVSPLSPSGAASMDGSRHPYDPERKHSFEEAALQLLKLAAVSISPHAGSRGSGRSRGKGRAPPLPSKPRSNGRHKSWGSHTDDEEYPEVMAEPALWTHPPQRLRSRGFKRTASAANAVATAAAILSHKRLKSVPGLPWRSSVDDPDGAGHPLFDAPPMRSAMSREARLVSAGRSGSGGLGRLRVQGPCANCGVLESPCWRRGPPNMPILCNACGTRYSRTHSVDGRVTPPLRQLGAASGSGLGRAGSDEVGAGAVSSRLPHGYRNAGRGRKPGSLLQHASHPAAGTSAATLSGSPQGSGSKFTHSDSAMGITVAGTGGEVQGALRRAVHRSSSSEEGKQAKQLRKRASASLNYNESALAKTSRRRGGDAGRTMLLQAVSNAARRSQGPSAAASNPAAGDAAASQLTEAGPSGSQAAAPAPFVDVTHSKDVTGLLAGLVGAPQGQPDRAGASELGFRIRNAFLGAQSVLGRAASIFAPGPAAAIQASLKAKVTGCNGHIAASAASNPTQDTQKSDEGRPPAAPCAPADPPKQLPSAAPATEPAVEEVCTAADVAVPRAPADETRSSPEPQSPGSAGGSGEMAQPVTPALVEEPAVGGTGSVDAHEVDPAKEVAAEPAAPGTVDPDAVAPAMRTGGKPQPTAATPVLLEAPTEAVIEQTPAQLEAGATAAEVSIPAAPADSEAAADAQTAGNGDLKAVAAEEAAVPAAAALPQRPSPAASAKARAAAAAAIAKPASAPPTWGSSTVARPAADGPAAAQPAAAGAAVPTAGAQWGFSNATPTVTATGTASGSESDSDGEEGDGRGDADAADSGGIRYGVAGHGRWRGGRGRKRKRGTFGFSRKTARKAGAFHRLTPEPQEQEEPLPKKHAFQKWSSIRAIYARLSTAGDGSAPKGNKKQKLQ